MCDDDAFDDMVAYGRRAETFSRRNFGRATLGAAALLAADGCKGSTSQGASASASGAAGDAPTTEAEVEIKTPDGTCDAYFVHRASGTDPAVLVWPDIFGLRPAFRDMGKRLAQAGYAVLVVNPFYRIKKAPTSEPHADMDDPATRDALMGMMKSLTADTAATDAKALVEWIDKQAGVDKARKMGVTGYCMGGPLVFRSAATMPDRIGAAATFHGGSLVTDKPDSPHLAIPKMKAHFLIAIAARRLIRKSPPRRDTLKKAFPRRESHRGGRGLRGDEARVVSDRLARL